MADTDRGAQTGASLTVTAKGRKGARGTARVRASTGTGRKAQQHNNTKKEEGHGSDRELS